MSDSIYDLKSIKLPRFSGLMLRLFVGLIESPLTRWLMVGPLLKQAGINHLREMRIDELPTFLPLHPADSTRFQKRANVNELVRGRPETPNPDKFQFHRITDYAAAYRKKTTDPTEVAERVIQAIEESNTNSPALLAIIDSDADDIRRQAVVSAQNLNAGRPRSVLEGVPIAIKDELDVRNYRTRVGTSFLGKDPAEHDASVVANLRNAGALIIGKANMHEIGIGVSGHNVHSGTPRNPYAPDHYTGGSSSGPAAAVAAGLCPAAVGADGGGSIRIPSAFCGLVGLKPTFGRVSTFGGAPLTWSNDQFGPLASSASDAAIMYAIMAGRDSNDRNTLNQPSMSLDGVLKIDMRGITLGIYSSWFEHGSPDVVSVCKLMLRAFEENGATIKKITIPELDATRISHLITIASEILTNLAPYANEHWKDYSLEVRTNLNLARAFTSSDYLQALRMRTRSMAIFNQVLSEVDAIVTPTTACTAPRIPKEALERGESDLTTLMEIMRFAPAANLTGLPAISFPAGYTKEGLPIGFQAIGQAWHEHVLLRIAHVAEGLICRKAPKILFDLLPKS